MARCAICYTVVGASEAAQQCPDCKTDYHQSCWNEIGGCGTYGCKKAAVAEKPPVPVLVGQGWGDQKPCPNCNAQIGSSLLVCCLAIGILLRIERDTRGHSWGKHE